MPDLFDDLRTLPAPPPAPGAIRAEGDRRRRRTRLLTAGATAAVLAAVALPLALHITSSDRSAPDPAEHTTPTPDAVVDASTLRALLPAPGDLIEFGETSAPWRTTEEATGLMDLLAPCGDERIPNDFVAASSLGYRTSGGSALGFRARAMVVEYPEARSASLPSADLDPATAAYRELDQAFTSCTAGLEARGEQDVSQTDAADLDLGSESASSASPPRTYLTTYGAPPDDHAVIQIQHGLVLDDVHHRLLVVTITQEVQEHWPDLADSMPRIVEGFLGVTSVPDAVLYDRQYGYIRLGESLEDLRALPGVTCEGGPGAHIAWHCTTPDGASVCALADKGVEHIILPRQTATSPTAERPDGSGGLRTGMRSADIARVYPAAVRRDDGRGWTVHTDNDSVYGIGDDGGTIGGITLSVESQSCAG